MDLVKFKRGLARSDLERKLGELLEEKVKSLPDFNGLKLNPELILLVCNMVEEGAEKRFNIDKKELVMKVLDKIFKYSDHEKQLLDDQIEFLHATKKIKKVRLIVKIIHYLVDWVSRRFL